MPCSGGNPDPTARMHLQSALRLLEEEAVCGKKEIDALTDMLCRVGRVLYKNDKNKEEGKVDREPFPRDVHVWIMDHKLRDEIRGASWDETCL